MRFIFCTIIFLCPYINNAQPTKQVNALHIGDTIPKGLSIGNLSNYPALNIQLSRLKGKMIILDFWSTWCGSCINEFPKMHQLQKEFRDQLQVFLVDTYAGDDIKRVTSLFKRRAAETGETVSLPYSLQQSALPGYFPYKTIPHYVWIDKGGKIIAITSQFEVTEKNIAAALDGKASAIHVKQDVLDFDNSQPLFVKGNGGDGIFLYRSIVTRYLEGLSGSEYTERTDDGRITRMRMVNTSALMLLRTAYPGKLEYPASRIIINAKEGRQFTYEATEGTDLYKNAYCYEISTPPCTPEELQVYMQQDISRVFHVQVKSEQRKIQCMVLKRTVNAISTPYTKGGKQIVSTYKNSIRKYLQNQPVNTLAELLQGLPAMDGMPVIDESGITQNIDLELPGDILEMPFSSLIAFLKEQGFDLVKEEKQLDVGVITDQ